MSFRSPTRLWVPLGALLILGAVGTALATSSTAPAPQKANKYIGADKCKSCHSEKGSGDQHGLWMQSKHAKAWGTLASDEAKKLAKEQGIDDPQTSDACVKCHVTGHGLAAELFDKKFDPKLGVQCESCHGPGEKHMKARLAAAGAEEEGAAKGYKAPPAGEIVVDVTADTCKGCHNKESPAYKPFCFHRNAAMVRHLNPNKRTTAEELAKVMACGCGDACTCDGTCVDKCAVPDPKVNKK